MNKGAKKIYYVAYYSDLDNVNIRRASPAADLQVSYLTEILQEIGYEVEIISPCVIDDRTKNIIFGRGYSKKIENKKVNFLASIGSKYRGLRILGYLLTRLALLATLLKKREGKIIIYHSLNLGYVYCFLHIIKRKFILEVEEIYFDVSGNMRNRKRELASAAKASCYIVPNRDMYQLFLGKKWVLYHGTCRREPIMKRLFTDGKIHVAYAGTLDPRVIRGYVMVKLAEYLDDHYKIEILGVGSDEEKSIIQDEIAKVTGKGCDIELHDCLYGEEYLQFIQSCDIGIYAQDSHSADIYTSFPSKIMSYLSNGLRVVATKTPVLEKSEVSHLLFWAEKNEPDVFADAIKAIDMEAEYDSRTALCKLEEDIKIRFANFLEG